MSLDHKLYRSNNLDKIIWGLGIFLFSLLVLIKTNPKPSNFTIQDFAYRYYLACSDQSANPYEYSYQKQTLTNLFKNDSVFVMPDVWSPIVYFGLRNFICENLSLGPSYEILLSLSVLIPFSALFAYRLDNRTWLVLLGCFLSYTSYRTLELGQTSFLGLAALLSAYKFSGAFLFPFLIFATLKPTYMLATLAILIARRKNFAVGTLIVIWGYSFFLLNSNPAYILVSYIENAFLYSSSLDSKYTLGSQNSQFILDVLMPRQSALMFLNCSSIFILSLVVWFSLRKKTFEVLLLVLALITTTAPFSGEYERLLYLSAFVNIGTLLKTQFLLYGLIMIVTLNAGEWITISNLVFLIISYLFYKVIVMASRKSTN